MKAAKEKELASKLIGLLARLYAEDNEQENSLKQQLQPELNLNLLIMAGNQRLMENVLLNQGGQTQTIESIKGGINSNR